MPLPNASLRAIELQFRGVPDDLSAAQKHRLEALTIINYLGNFGRLISLVSLTKAVDKGNIQYIAADQVITEGDDALFVLGEIQFALADTAYMAVEEMFTALTEQGSDVESDATGSD